MITLYIIVFQKLVSFQPLGSYPTSADGDYSLSIIVLYSEGVHRVDNYSEFKLYHGLMTITPNH